MRMFNPEWEAIRGMENASSVKDLVFDLQGFEIPADHGMALYRAIIEAVPELADLPMAIHPVHGAPSGRNDNLVINRRVKLMLRLPAEQAELAGKLSGCEIDPGAGPIRIGDLKVRGLTPYATLYSHLVVYDSRDEGCLLDEARAELEQMGVSAGLICGKRHKITLPEGVFEGNSLMLHDIKLDQSILIQERGLGNYRQFGCGVFIPHKSIKEVAID